MTTGEMWWVRTESSSNPPDIQRVLGPNGMTLTGAIQADYNFAFIGAYSEYRDCTIIIASDYYLDPVNTPQNVNAAISLPKLELMGTIMAGTDEPAAVFSTDNWADITVTMQQ